jgi:hypothetical protein
MVIVSLRAGRFWWPQSFIKDGRGQVEWLDCGLDEGWILVQLRRLLFSPCRHREALSPGLKHPGHTWYSWQLASAAEVRNAWSYPDIASVMSGQKLLESASQILIVLSLPVIQVSALPCNELYSGESRLEQNLTDDTFRCLVVINSGSESRSSKPLLRFSSFKIGKRNIHDTRHATRILSFHVILRVRAGQQNGWSFVCFICVKFLNARRYSWCMQTRSPAFNVEHSVMLYYKSAQTPEKSSSHLNILGASIMQVEYRERTDIRRRHTGFSCPGFVHCCCIITITVSA